MRKLPKREMINIAGGKSGRYNSRIVSAINTGGVDAIIHELMELPA